MKIELRHDHLAKKIYEAASLEDKARSKAVRLLHERIAYYQADPKILLTESELSYINAHLPLQALNNTEQAFVASSRRFNKQQQNRSRLRNYLTIGLACSAAFLAWGVWWRTQALHEERQANAHLIRLYELSQELRSVKNVAEVEDIKHKADDIVNAQLSDQNTKAMLKSAGVLKDDSRAVQPHAHLSANWKWLQLSGLVLADADGESLPDARLELGGAVFYTDNSGSFRLPILMDAHATNQNFDLYISKKGYLSKKLSINPKQLPQDLNISLTRVVSY